MKARPILYAFWIAAICAAAALHFVHIQADFPNYARWMDWSKYTDEGWYANAAIQHYLRGSWYVPGDFNVAAAVPVWPFLLALLFRFTGVSIVAARAFGLTLFCCNLALVYRLLRRNQPLWVPLFALTLIVTNSFLYCFGRLALLEPLLVTLTLTALLLARHAAETQNLRSRHIQAALLGALFCAMVLTKTTGVFLLPAILYPLWHPLRKHARQFLIASAIMAAVAAILWSSYFFLLVRPHYLADYHYFFHVNIYPKPKTLSGWLATVYYAAHGILWVDRYLTLTAIAMLAATLAFARSLWRDPVFVSSLLAIAGYVLFVTRIVNMQPRYYVVTGYFLFLTIPLAISALMQHKRRVGITALILSIPAIALTAWETGGFILYPEYTFVNAAKNLTGYINQHPNGNRIVVSLSGNDLSLITGIPSLCDEFGTIPLPDKLNLYRPGWYAGWNDLDPNTLEDLQTDYTLTEVANFKAFDADDRDTLILYKLTRLPGER